MSDGEAIDSTSRPYPIQGGARMLTPGPRRIVTSAAASDARFPGHAGTCAVRDGAQRPMDSLRSARHPDGLGRGCAGGACGAKPAPTRSRARTRSCRQPCRSSALVRQQCAGGGSAQPGPEFSLRAARSFGSHPRGSRCGPVMWWLRPTRPGGTGRPGPAARTARVLRATRTGRARHGRRRSDRVRPGPRCRSELAWSGRRRRPCRRVAVVAQAPGQVEATLAILGRTVQAGAPAVRMRLAGWRASFELPRALAAGFRKQGWCGAEIEGRPVGCSLVPTVATKPAWSLNCHPKR